MKRVHHKFHLIRISVHFLQRTIVTPPVATQLKDIKDQSISDILTCRGSNVLCLSNFFHCFVYFFTWFLCTAVYIPFLYKHTKTISSYMWTNGFCLSLRRHTSAVPQGIRNSYTCNRGAQKLTGAEKVRSGSKVCNIKVSYPTSFPKWNESFGVNWCNTARFCENQA